MKPKQWWRQATAAAKDRQSLYLARISMRCRSGSRNPELEVAIIKATSHDDTTIDYKNAGRVFTWARTSPSFLKPVMRALEHRMEKTRSWVVALKGLMLVHGLLLCSDDAPAIRGIGRLPFDLSSFRDRFSKPSKSWGFSTFVRAYFNYLDHRSAFLSYYKTRSSMDPESKAEEDDDDDVVCLHRLQRLQGLLDLLMQIRPYGDGMGVSLILEALDCVVIEIFEVYSGICKGIAGSFVRIFGSSSSSKKGGAEEREVGKRVLGIKVLKKAAEQSAQLSAYFEVCRGLGVMNAADLPAVESIPVEDIRDLERMVLGGVSGSNGEGMELKSRGGVFEEGNEKEKEKRVVVVGKKMGNSGKGCSQTVVTTDWVVFDDEAVVAGEEEGRFGNYNNNRNPFSCSWSGPWEMEQVYPSGSPYLVGLGPSRVQDPGTNLLYPSLI